jgi:phage terminase small subunit
MAGLTPNQKKFADEYIKTGNAKQSYINAGYKARGNRAEASASRLLRNVKVRDYIRQRNKEIDRDTIADMQEVKEFWTNVLRNKAADPKDRLKASELIAKTNGAFLDRVEHSGDIKVELAGEVKDWAK